MRNVIERAMIITGTSTLHVQMPSGPPTKETSMTMEALQTRHILAVLEQTGGRIRGPNGAAEILGMKPTTLDNRMKKLGIQRGSR